MRYIAKLAVTLMFSLLVGALIDGARADIPARKHAAKKAHVHAKKKKVSYGGEALKPKTNLKMDGRSVESLRAGKYDSLSIQDEGAQGGKRLYSLPANFKSRAADTESEMRYRQ